MEDPSLNFGGSIAQNYEEILGPFLFEPFAVDLVQRIDLTSIENILELACGSGRVTQHLAEKIPGSVNFVASDLAPDMLEVAKASVGSSNITWAAVDMQDIPFANEHFDLVVCQFGIMLVPDRAKALTEIFRVLKKSGKLIFSTWSSMAENKLWSIGNEILNAYLSRHPLEADPGPFSMSNEQNVLKILKTTGFGAYTVTKVSKVAEIDLASQAAHGFIQGLPVFSFIQQQAPHLLHEIISSLSKKLKEQLGDGPLTTPQNAWIFEAKK